MTYGLIDEQSHQYYTYLSTVFEAIENVQNQYNWLISDCDCYPVDEEISAMLNKEYCWLTGEELTELIAKEDFQWIWGALCAFEKDVPLDEILKHPLPTSQSYNDYYTNPVSLQHPLSSLEVILCDSSWLLIMSKDKSIIESYISKYPKAEDLSLYNQRNL